MRRFERSWMDEPREMVIVELEGEEAVENVAEILEEWEELEVRFWGLRRTYDESDERIAKGRKPTDT